MRACAPAASPMSASSAGSSTSRPSTPPHVFDALDRGRRRVRPEARAATTRMDCLPHREGLSPLGPRHHATRTRRSRPASASPSPGTSRAASSAARRCCGSASRARRRGAWCSSRSTTREPLLYHNEPIWRDGRIVGPITSGAYGHTLGALARHGLRAARRGCDRAWLAEGGLEVEVAWERVPAALQLEPFYDPKGERVRS